MPPFQSLVVGALDPQRIPLFFRPREKLRRLQETQHVLFVGRWDVKMQMCFVHLVVRHESFTEAGFEQKLLGGQVRCVPASALLKNAREGVSVKDWRPVACGR